VIEFLDIDLDINTANSVSVKLKMSNYLLKLLSILSNQTSVLFQITKFLTMIIVFI